MRRHITSFLIVQNAIKSNTTDVEMQAYLSANWLDFADALHLALSRQHAKLYSFDAKFVKKAKGLCGCVVVKP